MTDKDLIWEGKVDEKYGTINPYFKIDGTYTSGELKYLSRLKGKKVRLTLEVLPEDHKIAKKCNLKPCKCKPKHRMLGAFGYDYCRKCDAQH